MNSLTLKNTVPDPARSGSGRDALGSAQQRFTTRLYTSPPKNSIPFVSDQLIEIEYWTRRAEDALLRAWTHFRMGERTQTAKDLQVFYASISHVDQEISQ